MPRETSPLARFSTALSALLDAGYSSEDVAASLLKFIGNATSADCTIDGNHGRAGKSDDIGVTLVAEIFQLGQPRGQLRATVPEDNPNSRSLLELAARLVSLHLPIVDSDQQHLMELVTVGEACGYMIHSMNNYLNSMVLQAACIEMETQSPIRDQAASIRVEGARAASRLRPIQSVHAWPRRPNEQVDLIAAVREALRDDPKLTGADCVLADEEIFLNASAMGMKRLLGLLFRVARRCVPNGHRPSLRVNRSAGVELTIELPGCQCERDKDEWRLPPEEFAGMDQIERDALRWLVGQSGGKMEVGQQPRAAVVTIRWEDD